MGKNRPYSKLIRESNLLLSVMCITLCKRLHTTMIIYSYAYSGNVPYIPFLIH
jgi:hypothetical protein